MEFRDTAEESAFRTEVRSFIKDNLNTDFRAMGEDVLHAAIPVDRTAELTYQGAKHAGFGGAVLGFILGMLWDIGELLMVVPSLIWKSLNVVGHAGAEVVNLVQGEHDGTATGAQEFLWEQPPSFVIQTGAWIAGSSPINQYALNKPTGSGVALNKATDKA